MISRLYKPVGKVYLNADSAVSGGANILTSGYTEISSALPSTCSAVEIFNGTGQLLLLAAGAAASEVDFPYYVLPGGSSAIVPLNLVKGTRLSAKAVDGNATAGLLVFNLLA